MGSSAYTSKKGMYARVHSSYMKSHTFFTVGIALTILGAGCAYSGASNDMTVPNSGMDQPEAAAPQTGAKNINTLDLSNRGLTKIPSDVFSRTDLEALDLSGNALEGAPQAEIRHLQNLKTLDLSGNNLTGLPAELGQLKNLETLNVSNNELTGLPLELGNLTRLRVLDIRGNPYSNQDLDQIAQKLSQTEILR